MAKVGVFAKLLIMRPFLTTLVCMGLLSGNALAQAPEDPPTEGDAQAPTEEAQAAGDEDPHGVAAMRREELSDAAAMSLFNAASSLYEAGRFLDAARQFEAAYELSPRPSLLFNAYLAYRDAGRNEAAVRALAGYLEGAPDAPDAERLTARLAAMRESAEEDAAAAAEAATERRRLAEEAAAAERRAEEEGRRADDERRRLEEATRRSPIGIVMAATGGVALITGAVTGVVANNRFQALEQNCPDTFCSQLADLEGTRPGIRRLQRTTDALLFGGAALTITGLVLTFVLKPTPVLEPTEPTAEPTASCSFDSWELGVRGSF